jgi:hypothetical protein
MELIARSNKDFGSIGSVISLNIQKAVTAPNQGHGLRLPEVQNRAVGVVGLGTPQQGVHSVHPHSSH